MPRVGWRRRQGSKRRKNSRKDTKVRTRANVPPITRTVRGGNNSWPARVLVARLILAGQLDPPLQNRNRSALQDLNLCAFASSADEAKGGDGAKSALREIFCAWVAAIPSWPLVIHKCLLVVRALGPTKWLKLIFRPDWIDCLGHAGNH